MTLSAASTTGADDQMNAKATTTKPSLTRLALLPRARPVQFLAISGLWLALLGYGQLLSYGIHL